MKIVSVICKILLCIGVSLTSNGKIVEGMVCTSEPDANGFAWRWWITSGWWKKYNKGCDLHFDANDRIACDIPGQDWIIFTPKHHMLATSNTTVAHSFGYDTTARVLDEDWTTGPFRLRAFFGDEICYVQTAEYAEGRPDAIERAQKAAEKFEGLTTHYNLFTCNCEHWARYWMYDSRYSRQSFRYASEYCEL